MEELEFITFKQFIYTINIRQYYTNFQNKEVKDGYPIRIHYSEGCMDYKKEEWFDLSWYDFTAKETVWNNLSKILKEEVLNSFVTDFRYDEEIEQIVVYLEKQPNATLEEYQN